MSTLEMPAVSECTVAGCSYNHDGCHAFAITVGGAGGSADCGTFIPLSTKGGLDKVIAQVGACSRSECQHNAGLECSAPSVRIGAGRDLANCLTFALADTLPSPTAGQRGAGALTEPGAHESRDDGPDMSLPEPLSPDRPPLSAPAGAASPTTGGAAATTDRAIPRPSARAWVVWAVGVIAYVVAVLQRTSFGVAALDAADRFGATASALSAFTVLQLLVYALLQVPAGVLLDRFGTRRLVVVGALVMATGQFVLALGSTLPLAVLGRVLVGAGDALTFISLLRLVSAWFPPPQVPVVNQLTGLVGQLGQVLSAVPLAALLAGPGWTTAFVSAAALSVLAGVLVAVLVRDSPTTRMRSGAPLSWGKAGGDLVSAWRHPGTRLGLWSHFVTQFPGTVFVLIWGFPFLTSGEGLSQRTASSLVSVYVVVGIIAAPVIGVLVGRHPLRRSWLVLTITAVNVAGWTAVLAWPTTAPLWLLVVLCVALATGGPGSMVGFDFARTFNPADRQGTATGIVNIGGFFASLVTVLLVGVVLDVAGGYSLSDFRAAFAVQYLPWAVGTVGVLVARAKVRRVMAADGLVVPPLRQALADRRAARRAR